MKARPYLRSCRNLNHVRAEKPKYRLTKIDHYGHRHQVTLELVSEASLPDAIRAFLSPPPLESSQLTMTPDDDYPDPCGLMSDDLIPHAREAVSALSATMATNTRRLACGHPPVNCQLTGLQAAALSSMVMGLIALLQTKPKSEV